MTVRPNMQPLIDYLRREGQAAEDDEFNGVTYWTDQQLQDILDLVSNRRAAYAKKGAISGLIYVLSEPRHIYPDPDEITLLGADLEEITATYTYSLLRNELVFTTDPEISYIEASFINFWEAVAALWGEKANQRFTFIDNKSGQNSLKMEQEYKHCVERQQVYRNRRIRRWAR